MIFFENKDDEAYYVTILVRINQIMFISSIKIWDDGD